jgi:hypothetical protein
MLRPVSAVLVCVLLLPGVSRASEDGWLGRAGTGVIGEVAAVVAVGAGVLAYDGANHVGFLDEDAAGPAILGVLILIPGIPAATAGGVCIAGNAQGQDGRYWAAFLGGLAGLPVGFGVTCLGTFALSLSPYVAVPLYIAGAVAPAVGATVGYDLSCSRGWGADSRLDRFMPPSIAFASDISAKGKRSTRVDARLLGLRF